MPTAHPVDISQPTITVSVDYYNAAHKTALTAAPSGKRIEKIAGTVISVPTADWLAYSLFHRQQPGRPLYRTYASCYERRYQSVAWFTDMLSWNGTSVQAVSDACPLPTDITDRFGEATGLCVVDQMLGLTHADWDRIQAQHGPCAKRTLDWLGVATDEHILQVETKGSYADNNAGISGLSHHMGSIRKKKEDERAVKAEPAPELIGTIAVMDARPNSVARCWLLDPAPTPTDLRPLTFRLLARMRFLRDWIGFLGSHTNLAATLASRVAALEALRDPYELSGVRLRGGTQSPLALPTSPRSRRLAWFGTRSVVADDDVGGVIVPYDERSVMFVGVREEMLPLAVSQDFDRIAAYSCRASTDEAAVDCTLSSRRLGQLTAKGGPTDAVLGRDNYWRFRRRGWLHYANSGLVFGWLPVEP